MIRLFPIVLSVMYAFLLHMSGIHDANDLTVQVSYLAAPWMVFIYMIHYKSYGILGKADLDIRLNGNWLERNFLPVIYLITTCMLVGVAAYSGCSAQHLMDLTAVTVCAMGSSEIVIWTMRNCMIWIRSFSY